jgi:hypothetical protein
MKQDPTTGRILRVPLGERLWSKIDRRGPDECWPWIARARNARGYGLISVGLTNRPAHRVVYELTFGPVPILLDIDHLCRNTACCNPAHLEAVTRRENLMRGIGLSAQNARKTHCKRGHPLDEANTWRNPKNGSRHCRTCTRDRMRITREAQRVLAA